MLLRLISGKESKRICSFGGDGVATKEERDDRKRTDLIVLFDMGEFCSWN